MSIIELPDKFPRTITLESAEKALAAFGYELVLRPLGNKPVPAPIGFGYDKGDES